MLLEQFAWMIGLGLAQVHDAIFGGLGPLPDYSFGPMVALAKGFDLAIPVSEYATMLAVWFGVAMPLALYRGAKEVKSWFPFFI